MDYTKLSEEYLRAFAADAATLSPLITYKAEFLVLYEEFLLRYEQGNACQGEYLGWQRLKECHDNEKNLTIDKKRDGNMSGAIDTKSYEIAMVGLDSFSLGAVYEKVNSLGEAKEYMRKYLLNHPLHSTRLRVTTVTTTQEIETYQLKLTQKEVEFKV